MCFRILFFLSHHQNNISRHQTIVIKLANNNSGYLIKIYISNLKIEFVFLQINFLYACYQLFHDSITEINPEIGDTMTES